MGRKPTRGCLHGKRYRATLGPRPIGSRDQSPDSKHFPSCMHALRGVLRDYEVSSGQKVNLGKSSVYFGPGCEENMKNTLKV
jgi:hypothetical protein